MFANTLFLALQAIRRNLMRSVLTMLGIVIGVAAVIIMVTLGEGATQKITDDISSLGKNLLILTPETGHGPQHNFGAPFTRSDVTAIKREIQGLTAVAPSATKMMLTLFGNNNINTTITGTDNDYLVAREWKFQSGRAFSTGEIKAGKLVCILGQTIQKELFGPLAPLGADIRVGKLSCRVIGVLQSKGEAIVGGDQDNFIMMPLQTFHRRIAGNREVRAVQISLDPRYNADKVKIEIENLMRERRKLAPGAELDFRLRDMKEVVKIVSNVTGILTVFLGAIAAISLLVGGIGIMNIMLVSVTERTREIGIRLAIGALEREVLLQFLVEAVMLAAFGGVIGIALGLSGSYGIARLVKLPFVFNLLIVIIAFVFSAGVGVIFGYFPALKAARLNPIDALRHE